MKRVVVVGGGPAGLAAAFWRRRQDPDAEVTVVEASERPGGNVWSEACDGYLCEWGPQALRPTAASDELVAALGAEDLVVAASPAAKQRWVGRDGKLLPTPSGPGFLLRSELVRLRARLRALREPWVRSKGGDRESVADFVARRFGPRLVPLVDALVAGIFGGRAAELELRSAFPLLAELERDHGSVVRGLFKRPRAKREGPRLVTFAGGMQALTDRLAERVEPRVGDPARAVGRRGGSWAVELASGTHVEADELVVAAPAFAAARLLEGHDGELAVLLGEIPFAPIVNVWLGRAHEPEERRLRGFGFLLESDEPTDALGALYVSELFEGHAPHGKALHRVMLGGARHPDVLAHDDDTLRDTAIAALRDYAGARAPVEFSKVGRIEHAIPQYVPGHGERLAGIEQRLSVQPGLSLCGNSYRGIALGEQLGPRARALAPAAVA